jgi:GrpB-like predicted nucleotidyltransferase (UPF0157 family)
VIIVGLRSGGSWYRLTPVRHGRPNGLALLVGPLLGFIMVDIVDYKSGWPNEFREIASSLRTGLGRLALRIDHIGSTSVPGLASKDVIDIQITVVSLNRKFFNAMADLGYALLEDFRFDHRPAHAVGPDSEWEKRLFNPPPGSRRINMHVRIRGRLNQRYALLFRDYLRAHPAASESYAELKRRLARNLENQRVYSEVKDPAVDFIYQAAEVWATAIGWKPGNSDA